MLEKFIIHLKNIIFLKAVIYFLLIVVLLWLIPVFKAEFNSSLYKLETAESNLLETTAKLHSIVNSKDKILKTYQKISQSNKHRCEKRIRLKEQLGNLANKYDLGEPLNINLFYSFLKGANKEREKQVKIQSYDINISFSAPNISTSINLIKEAYELLPESSIITSLTIEQKEALDPAIIDKLSPTRDPNLISTKFTTRIREIRLN